MKRWFCGSVLKTGESSPQASFEPIESRAIWTGSSSLWLCGNWPKQQFISLAEGPVQIMIVGACLAPREVLLKRLRVATSCGDYSLLMRLPGNYNAIVHVEDDTYVFVDAMGVRLVFYTIWNSSVIYSSIAVALQQLINAEVDHIWLATFLAGVSTLSLTQSRSPFRGIHPIPPGHYLHIAPARLSCERYWYAPSEYRQFSQAAELLRTQLLEAVEGRIELYSKISSDLSGGFDSTTLAMIAARKLEQTNGKLTTITEKTFSAVQSSDVRCAEYAASLYSNINALFLEEKDIPPEYSYLELVPLTDFPSPAHAYDMGAFNSVMQLIKSIGSAVHMSGEGGDGALLATSYSYLIDLLKQAKFSKLFQHLSGWCRVRQLPLLSLLILTAKQSLISYPDWLQKIKQFEANDLTLQKQSKSAGMTWDILPTLASWHSEELAQQVLGELQDWAKIATPFSQSMGEHISIALMQLNAISAGSTQQIADLYDVNLEYPYFDQTVVEACLSARPEERTSPFVYKPLMIEAFQSVLPPSIYTRNTKGEYVADEFIGLRINRENIHVFFKDSKLADMKLIDVKKVRIAMQNFVMGLGTELALFSHTLATEIWLHRLTESNKRFWNLV